MCTRNKLENAPQILFFEKRHYTNFQRKAIILFTLVINRVINVINAQLHLCHNSKVKQVLLHYGKYYVP